MKCKNCFFWEKSKGEGHLDDYDGICRRYPPARDMDWSVSVGSLLHEIDGSEATWVAWQQPITRAIDWCGEYRE